MKKRRPTSFIPTRHLLKLMVLAAWSTATTAFAAGVLIVYPHSPLPTAPDFSVKANGCTVEVYNAGTFRCAPFAFAGTVTVEIAYHGGGIQSYQINPTSKGIVARKLGNTLIFTLLRPEKLEIQINGATSQIADGDKLLYLFADAPEVNIPNPDDSGIIYCGPGTHDIAGGLLKIDDTNPHSALYVAPGAVLNAALLVKRTKPFKIFGRGFIQNPSITKGCYAIGLEGCVGLVLEDVTFFNSIWHGIKFLGGESNVVRNVKALHYIVNSDGISLHGSAKDNLVKIVSSSATTTWLSSAAPAIRRGLAGTPSEVAPSSSRATPETGLFLRATAPLAPAMSWTIAT